MTAGVNSTRKGLRNGIAGSVGIRVCRRLPLTDDAADCQELFETPIASSEFLIIAQAAQ